MLIAFCGIDGSGKTTQIKLMHDYLIKNNIEVFLTKQPTNFYRSYDRFRLYVNREIDVNSNIIYELALLSAADKIRHYETEILPNLDKIVITDRYIYSAYTYFLARGINDIEWLSLINKKIPKPDIVFYIDVPAKIALKRIVERDGKYTKKEETDYELLEKVRENFLTQPWGKNCDYYIIDGTLSLEIVREKIFKILREKMGGKICL